MEAFREREEVANSAERIESEKQTVVAALEEERRAHIKTKNDMSLQETATKRLKTELEAVKTLLVENANKR